MRLASSIAATLAVAAAAGPLQAQTAVPVVPMIPADGATLDVSATGKVVRTPDIATVRAGVVTQAPTAAAALQENATRMARVVAALRGSGIAARDIATANVSLSPQYRYADNQPPVITGYQASNSVSIRFRDVGASGKALDVLVREGANQIDGPSLSLDQPDAALDAARSDAVARARARAELYARASGLRIDRIVSIEEAGESAGGPQPPVVFRAMAMRGEIAQADTAVLPGETDVTATVRVRFLLK